MHARTCLTLQKTPCFRFLLTLIILCVGCFFHCAIAAPSPLAILTDVKGTVSIQHQQKIIKGSSGTQLFAGDVVRVASGQATVYYVTQPPRSLRTGQSAIVGKAAASGASSATWSNVYASVSSGFARRRTTRFGTMRAPDFALISPVGTAITAEAPLLIWTKDSNAVDYKVTLKDAAGAVVWEEFTPSQFILYNGKTALQPEVAYSWEVTPREKSERGELEEAEDKTTLPATFTIAPRATRQAVDAEWEQIRQALINAPDETRRNARAAMLLQHGLYSEAIGTLIPEIMAFRTVAAGESLTIFKKLLPQASESTRLLLHNAFDASNRGGWIKLMDEIDSESNVTAATPQPNTTTGTP